MANWLASQRADVPNLAFGWERHIPFLAWTIVPYWSINAFYALSLFVNETPEAVGRLARRYLTAQIVAVACFVAFPLQAIFVRPETSGLPGFMFDVLGGFDKPFNQAPSLHIALLVVYFVCGYLMFGVSFAAIGAFCETQKDAQAIMGPVMIVLMIPMLCMQSAMIAPDSPVIRWLSFVPIFTPFLMPLRLADSVPWWEIAVTLGLMLLLAWLMIRIGRRAFRQGALAGGRLSWGRLARIATKREGM